jgi:hypothetical protein
MNQNATSTIEEEENQTAPPEGRRSKKMLLTAGREQDRQKGYPAPLCPPYGD